MDLQYPISIASQNDEQKVALKKHLFISNNDCINFRYCKRILIPLHGSIGNYSVMSTPDIQQLLRDALRERDQMWRAHEKAQIDFLQTQNAHLLTNLHNEIERLISANRDLERKLIVGVIADKEHETDLEDRLATSESKNVDLMSQLAKSKKNEATLKETIQQTVTVYKEQLEQHENRIRQLIAELHDRTLTVTHLTTQLRSIKLKDAMAQAQQRRRASCATPKTAASTIKSPGETNAAFRLFGFVRDFQKTTRSATQPTGTQMGTDDNSRYGGSQTASICQPLWNEPEPRENNIEKPHAPSTSSRPRPRHITTIRRTESVPGRP